MVARQRRLSSTSGSSGTNSDTKEAKDPQRCQRCLNHGYERIRKGHNCPYRSQSHLNICDRECNLIDLRRNFNKMIKTLKEEDMPIDVEGTEEDTTESPTGRNPFCANCRAHGALKPLRGHKKLCPYRGCDCKPCYFINSRKKVMARQVKLRRRQQMTAAKKLNEENPMNKVHRPLPSLCKPTPTRPVFPPIMSMIPPRTESENFLDSQNALIHPVQLGRTANAASFTPLNSPVMYRPDLRLLPPSPVEASLQHPFSSHFYWQRLAEFERAAQITSSFAGGLHLCG